MRPLWEPVFFYSSYLLQSSDSDNCPNVGIGPLLQFPHLLRAGPVLLTLLFSPLVSSSYQFCVVLYILFPWSGTLVLSQLVFCMHFCVWRCIPEVSMERDEFHIHLLLRHLVLLQVVVFAYVLCILIIIYIYSLYVLLLKKYCSSNRWGKSGNWQLLFSWAPKWLQTLTEATKLKDACSLE